MVLDDSTWVAKQCSMEQEYKKNPNISSRDIAQLREWVNRQPHLPFQEITDLDLLLMYHACQYSIEVSKQTIDLNLSLRTVHTNMFKDRSVDAKIKNGLHTVVFTILPEPTTKGATILYVTIMDPDPKKFVWLDLFKAFFMLMDLYQYEVGTWPKMALVLDTTKLQLSHLGTFDPGTILRGFHYLQEAYPVHLTEFIIVNAPNYIEKFMVLVRPLLGKTLQDMLEIYPAGSDTVWNALPKRAFPSDSEGNYKSWAELRDETWNRIKNNQDFFKMENKKRVNESLRPGGSKKYDVDTYGLEGNFKKLDLD